MLGFVPNFDVDKLRQRFATKMELAGLSKPAWQKEINDRQET